MDKIKKIFQEIDGIIKANINARPILFDRSQFKQDYELLKKEYLKKEIEG